MKNKTQKSVHFISFAWLLVMIFIMVGSTSSVVGGQTGFEAIDSDAIVHNVWVDVPLTQVLRDISVETGVVIALSPNVPDDIVSLDAGIGKSLKNTLEELLAGRGLYVFKKNKNFYLISTGDPSSPGFNEFAQSKRIYLKYVTAKHFQSCLPRTLQPYVSSGERPNEILIYAIPEIAEQVMRVVTELDTPRKQVVLEVLVVEVTEEAEEQFGIDWEYAGKEATLSMAEGVGAFTNIAKYTSVPQRQFSTVLATIRSLVRENKASIRSRPRVATLNGETASIDISLDEYYSIATDIFDNSLRTELEVIKSGVLLQIKPQIGDLGDITVDVLTEVSDVVARQNTMGDRNESRSELPVIRRRRADTSVRVKHGDAIVIGGLVESTEENELKKVPVFGDIPVVGNIFKAEKKKEVKKEVIIFITPKYVKGDEQRMQNYMSNSVPVKDQIRFREELIELIGDGHGSIDIDREKFKLLNDDKRIAIEKEIKMLQEVAMMLRENNMEFYSDNN